MVSSHTFSSKEEWAANRTKIGGSDAGVIMGVSHWKNNVELWREKTGRAEAEDISDNPAVQYGTRTESIIRDLFRAHHPDWGVAYKENNMWLNDRLPFAHASLDGWIETEGDEMGILEIKTADILKKSQAELWNGRVPDSYYCQILHYLMVTEFDFAIVCAELQTHRIDGTTEWRIVERRIDRNEVFGDINLLEKREREFWDHVTADIEPALLLPKI